MILKIKKFLVDARENQIALHVLVERSLTKVKSRENTCWVRETANRSTAGVHSHPRERNSISDPKPETMSRERNERTLLCN